MRAGMTAGIEKSFLSAAAIQEYRLVMFGADDNTVATANGSAAEIIGVAQHETAAAGEEIRVMLTGIAEVRLGGAVTRGQLITSDANGQGVAATQHAHAENLAAAYTQNATTASASAVRVIGRALASGAAGDIIPVFLAPGIA